MNSNTHLPLPWRCVMRALSAGLALTLIVNTGCAPRARKIPLDGIDFAALDGSGDRRYSVTFSNGQRTTISRFELVEGKLRVTEKAPTPKTYDPDWERGPDVVSWIDVKEIVAVEELPRPGPQRVAGYALLFVFAGLIAGTILTILFGL